MAKTMQELAEISLLISTAETLEDRRRLHALLRATETEVESSDDLVTADSDQG
jgi:hypothetical protein